MSKQEDANLILKLYDLRREEVMRKARSWFVGEFHPGSIEDVGAAALGEQSAYFRMVTSYWEMACSLVTNGAIDEQMFNDANGEHMAVYAKIEPFVAQIRESRNMPTYMQHTEKVVMNMPNARERLTQVREMLKQMAAQRAEANKATTA
jgi:hypothetical protein